MTGNPADRLESWKEIAAFIGKDERTAMRWAQGHSMPVHRFPGLKRARIYASRAEITQWMKLRDVQERSTSLALLSIGESRGRSLDLQAKEKSCAQQLPQSKLEHTVRSSAIPTLEDMLAQIGPRKSNRLRRLLSGGRLALAIAIMLAAVGATFVLLRPTSSHASQPSSVKFGDDTLEARDAEGRILWIHRFPHPLSKSYLRDMPKVVDLTRIVDSGQDGNRQVLAVAPMFTGLNPSGPDSAEIDFFSNNGNLLWSYLPSKIFQFGNNELRGPWSVLDVLVSGTRNRSTIWATAVHHTWGNSFVVGIDPKTGQDTVRFVNTGVLYKLNELHTVQQRFLLVGGFNNEWDGGSLAIFNEDRPFATSPQTPGTRHKCESCPAGSPDYYFVFPRSELNRISGIYLNPVVAVHVTSEGIQITKYERISTGLETTIYLLNPKPPFDVISVRYNSDYDMLHHTWTTSGKLGHKLENCPERLNPKPIRLWTPSAGWTELKLTPARLAD